MDADVIVIGSGFGGSMIASALIESGHRVLMLERGDWVRRGAHNRGPEGIVDRGRHYFRDPGYRVNNGRRERTSGAVHCVGGPSVFYGGVSFRFRPEDFHPDEAIAPGHLSRWPFDYGELQPHYARAERVLGVAGAPGSDPHDPPRSSGYPAQPSPLSPISQRIASAARARGHSPFRLPLAINFGAAEERATCVRCDACDGFPCSFGAKNDLATAVLTPLLGRGLELRANTAAVRLLANHPHGIRGVEVVDTRSLDRSVLRAPLVVLSAGALASPLLLLGSGLDRYNPGGHVVGRYLMRHCSAIAYGLFPRLEGSDEWHKQIGINDLYFGHTGARNGNAKLSGKLGNIQQVPTPARAYARAWLPASLAPGAALLLRRMTGLLTIAEDQPQERNRVTVRSGADALGFPLGRIHHRYSERDLAARRVLVREAKRIVRGAGAWLTYTHILETFSHACGSVRCGDDPRWSALDRWCAFRGVPGLYVVDASFMPRSAGLNPSLTIAANALRVGEHINSTA